MAYAVLCSCGASSDLRQDQPAHSGTSLLALAAETRDPVAVKISHPTKKKDKFPLAFAALAPFQDSQAKLLACGEL